MPELKGSPFRKTRRLQIAIDEFLDVVAEASMVFEKGTTHFVQNGCDDATVERYDQIEKLEGRGDSLRRKIELTLYAQMLIPDARGDVLGVLDDLDHLVDRIKKLFQEFTIERLDIPSALAPDVRELVAAVSRCIESTVSAARAYFRDPGAVRDHIQKIGFFESEADAVCIRLRKTIAASDRPLVEKRALRDGLMAIDRLADDAEDAGDRLAIFAVKRSL
jgi:predicted phosphate transport protein (TIGR00153 family)